MKPIPSYRVKLAFGFYRVGQILQLTGLNADDLMSRGFVEPYVVPATAEPPVAEQPPAEFKQPEPQKPLRKTKRAVHESL